MSDKKQALSSPSASAPPPSLPLVWVTIGKTQHSAHLVEEDASTQQCWVQWTSTQQVEQVASSRVAKALSPRRRKVPERLEDNDSHDDDNNNNEPPPGQAKRRKSTSDVPTSSGKFSLTKVKNPAAAARRASEPKGKHSRTTKGFYATSKRRKSISRQVDDDDNDNHGDDDVVAKEQQATRIEDAEFTLSLSDLDEEELAAALVSEDSQHALRDMEMNDDDDDDDAPDKSAPKSASQYKALSVPSETISSTSARTTETPGFPLIQSAYIQNLAEICNIISKDGRWRVEGSEPLLKWEDGVDLSAVTYLSRCYIPPEPHVRKTPCICLLCRDNPTKPSSNVEPAKANSSSTQPTTASRKPQNNGASVANSEMVLSDEEVRWIHLFCRLFYRRGPWFRMDDVYDRYYKPGRKRTYGEKPTDNEPDNDGSNPVPVPSGGNENDIDTSTSSSRNRGTNSRNPIKLDASMLESHLECFSDLVHDLCQLSQAGLIRAFRDEEECGKTVGVTLLTADMRANVLSKLGGGRRRSSIRGMSQSAPGNAIWNQMRQQKSILSSFSGSGSTLLPVLKHVDEVILDLMVTNILKSSCKIDSSAYLPASIHKGHARTLQHKLQCLLRRDGLSHFSCFRLREEPFIALLRCCRLFLCATSGPGDMRSDETNGWKSLLVCHGTPPLHKRVRRPGIDTWCLVSYPGSLTRFGRTSAFFINAYESVDPSLRGAVRKQIFFSRHHFLAWESAVELRVNVDYLLELTDLVRYETRRMERDDSSQDKGRSTVGTFEGDSVDYLGLLTEEGRRRTVKKYFEAGDQVKRVCTRITELLQSSSDMKLREWERILVVTAFLCTCVLDERYRTITEAELSRMEARPWLRHLWWEGCIAYLCWDLIPILEKFDIYDYAVVSLKMLIYGREIDDGRYEDASRLAPLLLSRRARGKAFDRLIIDLNHVGKQENNEKTKKQKKLAAKSRMGHQATFCENVLTGVVETASIPFSAIRGLARRLKRPLCETIYPRTSLEAQELGLRLENTPLEEGAEKKKGYKDWTPVTDFALANNVLGPDATVGSRCVFVGHEDESFNVEQLAMECYKSGKLPVFQGGTQNQIGGWEGWHDEGGHVRALFRIVCGGPLLGMDWGCAASAGSINECEAVQISPHQGAPFDLHVGFEISSASSKTTNNFYARRRDRIESFLVKVACLNKQEICDLVFDSVAARLAYAAETGRKDPSLERDLENVRTFSLIAAGCGGELLAAIFRCLLFDYRHWSGGLPDLLLVRAFFEDMDGGPCGLVDLSAWVGESFSEEFQLRLKNQAGAAMLADDEFLGCSKVGDSGGTQNRSSRRSLPQQSKTIQSRTYTAADMPQRLQLTHNGTPVIPQCMMVEVKSSNDRLDPRQEDWLNVLDRYGNARVCKFEDSKKFKRRAQLEGNEAADS